MEWKLITDIVLIIAILTVGTFASLGLYQWVKRKSFKKIDKEIRWMPLPLALMAATYVIFDKLIILSTRPNGSGESSFPSTHTMIVATVFFITTIVLPKYVKSKSTRIILEILMIVGLILTGIGRVLANMHWPLDIFGGLVFAFIFSEIYYLTIKGKKAKK